MKMTIDMPAIARCEVIDCAYNSGWSCHAHAITVGDGGAANCDTYLNSVSRRASPERAGVGACKVTQCQHNRDFACLAASVSVEMVGGRPQCSTCAGV